MSTRINFEDKQLDDSERGRVGNYLFFNYFFESYIITYLKSIQRAIVLYSECLGVIHWEEVAILA